MKTLVLLHGWGTNAAVFEELSGHLAAHFSVYAPDLPGYGGTHPTEAHALEGLAAELSAASPVRCHVAGWSLGAQVALCWAHAKPRQVESVSLISATPCFTRRADWTAALERHVLAAFENALEHDCERTLRRFASLQARGDDAEKRVTRKLRAVLACAPEPGSEALAHGLRILADADLRSLLAGITQRCLLVHGERDELVPLAAAEYLAARLPAATLRVVPGAAHAPFVSDVEAVARALTEHCA